MKKLLFLLLLPALAHAQNPRLSLIADAAPTSITITGGFILFTNVTGSPSGSQFVGVAGTGLTVPITIPCPAGFQTAPDGSTWGTSTLSYSLTGGQVVGQFFWMRVAAATAAGSYSGNAVASSSPAAPVNIPYSATVSLVPFMSALPASISGIVGISGTSGTPVPDTLTFGGLGGANINVAAPTNYEVSIDGGLSYAPNNNFTGPSPFRVFARLTSTAPVGPNTGNLTYHTTGLSDVTVGLNGTVSTSGSSSDTFRFAMSLTSQTVPAGFVSFWGDPSTGVRTATNQAGNITISTNSTANWGPVAGGCANDADGVTGSTVTGFPDNILKAQMYTYSDGSNLSDSSVRTLANAHFVITGLNSSKTYHLEMTANLDAGRFALTAANKFRAKGSTTTALIGTDPNGGLQTVNFLGNTSRKLVIASITPDGTGKINVYIFTEPGQEIAPISGLVGWAN